MEFVFDACAMIALLRDEPGAAEVGRILSDGENRCHAHSLNLCEVFYDFYRVGGRVAADSAVDDLLRSGIAEVNDLSSETWQAAGILKATHKRISLADCFAIVLAQKLKAVLLTSDHREFDPIAQEGACRIQFIR